jgi:hypothetical protein
MNKNSKRLYNKYYCTLYTSSLLDQKETTCGVFDETATFWSEKKTVKKTVKKRRCEGEKTKWIQSSHYFFSFFLCVVWPCVCGGEA